MDYGALYRAEAVECIQSKPGLAPKQCTGPRATTPQLAVFADVVKYIRDNCDSDVARGLFPEIEHVIACCG